MWACPKCREQHEDRFDSCWNCGTSKPGSLVAETLEAAKPPTSAKVAAPVRCAKCGSDRVVPRATMLDQGQGSSGTLQAYVYSKPGALFFKGTTYATLFARICGQCGFVELFAEGADKLYESYRGSQEPEENGS